MLDSCYFGSAWCYAKTPKGLEMYFCANYMKCKSCPAVKVPPCTSQFHDASHHDIDENFIIHQNHRSITISIKLILISTDRSIGIQLMLVHRPESRLALVAILNCRMDGSLVLIGLLCSSFVAINRGTNRRFPFNPLGDTGVEGVRIGNLLTTRRLGI